jgi:5-formyltetrahydrofolate cyclo-ligase
MVIGVGHACAAMATIHPQPHDIPMDVILAGGGRVISRTA